jgi:hypothetical protein
MFGTVGESSHTAQARECCCLTAFVPTQGLPTPESENFHEHKGGAGSQIPLPKAAQGASSVP